MPAILNVTLDQVLTTFAHNWPFLLAGAILAGYAFDLMASGVAGV